MVTARLLNAAAALVWRMGDGAGWLCRGCYRLSGRLRGFAYEVSKPGMPSAPHAVRVTKGRSQGGPPNFEFQGNHHDDRR